MILVADMVESLCPNQIADNAVARRTAEGFATVKQEGKGWTWEPHAIGLGVFLAATMAGLLRVSGRRA